MMNGMGVLRGLLVTLRHFAETYTEDWRSARAGKKRYFSDAGIAERSGLDARGIITVQYPEEKIPVPEEFRYMPFLVYESGENGEKNLRCTSCGICAKVCPPQCIWIMRTTDPVTGKIVPVPAQFYIDIDICMNCGLCAEYCPFDAIRMDHDYEIATKDRFRDNLYDLQKLAKSAAYYESIRPLNYAREQAAKQAEKEAKAARKGGTTA